MSAPAPNNSNSDSQRGRKPRQWRRREKKPDANAGDSPADAPSSSNDAQSNPRKRRNGRRRGSRRGGRGAAQATSDYVRDEDSKAEARSRDAVADQLPTMSTSVITKNTNVEDFSTEQAARLAEALTKGQYECMVCFDRIGKKAAVWSCQSCYAVFHIHCIKQWSHKSTEAPQDGSKQVTAWACPGCRSLVKQRAKASCFCGKMDRPVFDPFLTPHSCGETCQRPRTGTSCQHRCTQACHPGPCPPCPAMGPQEKCYCGKTVYRLRCGEPNDGKSCQQTCDKLRSCGKHRCEDICHESQCKPCALAFSRACYCGRETREMLCGTGVVSTVADQTGYFACESRCDRQLACGNHVCQLPCHPGDCPPCSTGTHLTTCPCGKLEISQLVAKARESCLDELPVCGRTCEGLLACGMHRCEELCHLGPCAPCTAQVKTPCRCGSTKQQVACAELHKPGQGPSEVLCQIDCQQKRQCGRHRCNTTCCAMYQIGKMGHPCPLTCGRWLSCKQHQCKKECHRGKCPPCLEASFDELSCRCGQTIMFPPIACGAQPPECPLPCSRPHDCDHPITHNCHNEDACPRCYVLVYRQCGCGRKEVMTQCHVQAPCCGNLCRKALKCGIHRCQRSCHGGSCTEEEIESGQSCGNRCNAGKLMCEHKCSATCHPGENCPNEACEETVALRCPCGNFTMKGKCGRGGPKNNFANDDYIRLECNDVCVTKMRRQQLASAFGKPPDTKAGVDVSPAVVYSVTLTNAAVTCPQFIKQVEEAFERLLVTKSVLHRFPPMNSYYRSIIHQLAEHYGLSTASEGYDPVRNVVVSQNATSKRPAASLTSVVARYPVPRQPGTGDGINTAGKPATLLLHGLNPSVTTADLHRILTPYSGEYFLKWIDDENAAVTFNDEATMRTAAYHVSPISSFQCKEITDQDLDVALAEAEARAAEVKKEQAAEQAPVEEVADVPTTNL